MKRKYGNTKVVHDGIEFASKFEARRYLELSSEQYLGRISELEVQVPYLLIPAQYEPSWVGKRGAIHKGKLIERPVIYVADFVYKDADGKLVVEDTKGCKTRDYIIKRKLMLQVHGIRIKEIEDGKKNH